MAGPGLERAGTVDRRHVELVDILPTFLDVAGPDPPETLPGLSLLPALFPAAHSPDPSPVLRCSKEGSAEGWTAGGDRGRRLERAPRPC